ncbi:ornithine cyclodeaminase family protein [Falsochrobactrum sp. TDYN1]|uniref:Ornithine cyclodeaminase family protein n=1 Tax=Falsochrobactrum tianjinense TaxID=2706015 RepID=A0A949PRP8_9HYPH|nr:ornithine cyclodeaminase family protein [Falsochrobactrum sp. TDYN1]MBV2143660.1 ornithine cyclodeaminase family protein [Falsochrobactrum sp. TDYN1]
MINDLLYLSRMEVEHLVPSRSALRVAVAEAVRNTASGQLKFLPKSTLAYATGHSFQSMPALVSDREGKGVATIKWVSVVPAMAQSSIDNVHSIICVNDLGTGRPLAIMDGNYITLVRTAALSALAAEHMLAIEPISIGFIGCGQQAAEHLLAFCDLYPSLKNVACFSRSQGSAQKLANSALALSLKPHITPTPEDLLQNCDIVISTVPSAPGFAPFLDAEMMKDNALAIMVDLGRSWLPEGFRAFEHIATDSLHQSMYPYDNQGNEVRAAKAQVDLETLVKHPLESTGKKAFFFKGIASADLAVAAIVYQRALEEKSGIRLQR